MLKVRSPMRGRSGRYASNTYVRLLIEPFEELFRSRQRSLHSGAVDILHPILVWRHALAFTLLICKDGPEANPVRVLARFQVFVSPANRVLERPNALADVRRLLSHVHAHAMDAA